MEEKEEGVWSWGGGGLGNQKREIRESERESYLDTYGISLRSYKVLKLNILSGHFAVQVPKEGERIAVNYFKEWKVRSVPFSLVQASISLVPRPSSPGPTLGKRVRQRERKEGVGTRPGKYHITCIQRRALTTSGYALQACSRLHHVPAYLSSGGLLLKHLDMANQHPLL